MKNINRILLLVFSIFLLLTGTAAAQTCLCYDQNGILLNEIPLTADNANMLCYQYQDGVLIKTNITLQQCQNLNLYSQPVSDTTNQKDKQQEEEARRQREEALRKQQEEEALRKQQEEEALRKQQEEEALRKQQEEEALRKQQEEETLSLTNLQNNDTDTQSVDMFSMRQPLSKTNEQFSENLDNDQDTPSLDSPNNNNLFKTKDSELSFRGNPTDTPTPEPTEEKDDISRNNPADTPTPVPTEEKDDISSKAPTDTPTSEPTRKEDDISRNNPADTPTPIPTEEKDDISSKVLTDTPTSEPTREEDDISRVDPTDTPTPIPTGEKDDISSKDPTNTSTPVSTDDKEDISGHESTVTPTTVPTEEKTAVFTESSATPTVTPDNAEMLISPKLLSVPISEGTLDQMVQVSPNGGTLTSPAVTFLWTYTVSGSTPVDVDFLLDIYIKDLENGQEKYVTATVPSASCGDQNCSYTAGTELAGLKKAEVTWSISGSYEYI